MNRDPFVSILIVAALVIGVGSASSAERAKHDTLDTANGPLVIHPIEHATFVMEWDGRTVYVDPVGGAERFADFPAPDLVLVSHIHGDHLSADTLAAVTSAVTPVLAPASVADALGDRAPAGLTILAHGSRFDNGGITVEALPAYNLDPTRLEFHPRERNDNSYLVTMGGLRLYISGDTEDIPEMRSLQHIDAAFICMNLPYTMTVEQAADAVLDFAPHIVYPYHYRGKNGMSDLDRFTALVAADPSIEVRRLAWY